MTQELYNKISNNVEQYILQYLDERDDCYLLENEDRVIKKYINEICNEKKLKMDSCTEKETEAFRKLMGIDNNGEKQTYKQVCTELNKHNVKQLVFNANRKLISSIYKEMLLEDKVKLIQLNFQYITNQGMMLPENIKTEDLSSIIYYEREPLENKDINTVKDIIEYSKTDIYDIIQNTKTKRKGDTKKVAKELINAINIMGFYFKNEDGFEEQQKYFKRLREIIKDPSKNYYNDEDIKVKKELYSRKYLIEYLNELLKQQKYFTNNSKEIEKEIEVTKEKIIKTETKIRTRNNKHR